MEICQKCLSEKPDQFNLPRCSHILCGECLCDYLKNFEKAKIQCPIEGCEKIISDKIIRECLSNDQTQYYNSLCFSPKTVKCLIPDCFYFISYSGEQKEGHFVCPICSQPNCVACGKLHDIDDHCQSIIDYNPETFRKAAKIYLQEQRKHQMTLISDEYDLLPNPNSFECLNCDTFILPRKGVTLRKCIHEFCKSCLDKYFKAAENLENLTCLLPNCAEKLSEREAIAFIGKVKFQTLSLRIIGPRLFNCQTPECQGMWDFKSFVGKYECPVCKVVNCGACRDIHGDISCEEFSKTPRNRDSKMCIKKLKEDNNITCHKCKTIITKDGGCNALRCPTCKLQVCAYTGQEIGPRGCKCTQIQRCVDGCSPGCIPEGNTPYEKELKNYFYGYCISEGDTSDEEESINYSDDN